MIARKHSKNRLRKAIFGCLFGIISLLGLIAPVTNVYAEPVEGTTGTSCEENVGQIAWFVCPETGAIAKGVDWLHDKIEDILVINPVEMKDGAPIYEIWKYARTITNIVFIIFLLVVVYSQITGIGISNYGIKKALPKLIVVAILVNLSFYICSIAVDVSNILGTGLRDVFSSIESATASKVQLSEGAYLSMYEIYNGLADGLVLAGAAAVISFETGSIWMLIPVVLFALVSVASGFITIAMRQAVVALLIMISPLAIVAYMLPNTESLFKKWKQLFTKMLVFYPMFSLLFGASSLAGWAIIASAQDGFGVMLGVAVQIFPLFFSWSLMKMSGTFLSTVNAKLRGLAAGPLATNKAWAQSHKEATRQKYLASNNAFLPSLRLRQFLSNRRIAREEETKERAELVRNRGLAYGAMRNYKDKDIPSKDGEESYEMQARNMQYQRQIMRHKNNMNKGLGQLEAVQKRASAAQKARLADLDRANMDAADLLKTEQDRGEKIDYENAQGRYNRMEGAINAHMDLTKGFNADGTPKSNYKFHFEPGTIAGSAELARYNAASEIMEGNLRDVQYTAAGAAHSYDTQKKIIENKMQKYFDMLPPTKDLINRLDELTTVKGAYKNIDLIISGMRVLNQRGDTDLVKDQMNNLLDKDLGGGIELGTHASQELAKFLMFEVKDSDPYLRRFGKYINLETAQVFNKNKRKEMNVTYDEYVRGYHYEPDSSIIYAKKGMEELIEGTSFDNIERTALASYDDSLIRAYTGKDGKLDYDAYINKRKNVDKAAGPAFISANLKYLSGSEQIVSAVRFKTGYCKQQKEDGTYEMVPIWETDDYKKIFAGHEKDIEEWYRGKTMEYLKEQTPSQILSLRSDYRNPLSEHLINEYMGTKMEGWSDEAKAERAGIMNEWSELQTKYGDLSTKEAREKYEKESEAIKTKMVGAQFRQLLDSKGKLYQIYRTRRSGAANNAKDWVREWLDLDDELLITKRLEDDKRKMKRLMKEKEENKRVMSESDDTANTNGGRIYDDVDMASFVTNVEEIWHNLKHEDDDVFYNESLEYIQKNLGKDSYIAKEYEQFRKDDPYADSHMLKEYLEDLLNDPDNY